MAASFYVYYRIAADAHALARMRVEELLDRVERESGVRGRLMRKRDEPQLWMEVYERVPDEAAFTGSLNGAVAALGVERLLDAGWSRKVECFED
jgi:hypothetical protein